MSDPIKLGSAAGSRLIFEQGSKITTSESGIQTSAVKAICGDGQNILSVLPAAGDTYNTVFGNSYLPPTFKVDYSASGPDLEYLGGKAARVTLYFKRVIPGTRKISTDSAINYKSIVGSWGNPAISTATGETPEPTGFPEPIVTVKYNSVTEPQITGGTGSLYALPESSRAAGFPTLGTVNVAVDFNIPDGGVVSWFNGITFQSFTADGDTLCHFRIVFDPNPLGWQLQKLKFDPIAVRDRVASFYDVEETWRNSYFFTGVQLISHVP
jgi:hypothetical protein